MIKFLKPVLMLAAPLWMLMNIAQSQTVLQVTYQSQGRLMVQPVTGGVAHPANQPEKNNWLGRKPSPLIEDSPEEATYSPDGNYLVTLDKGVGVHRWLKRWTVGAKVLTNSEIMRLLNLSDAQGTILQYKGWLPTGDYLVVGTFFHTQEQNTFRRAVIDINTKHLIAFNGWLSPPTQYAIVPSQERIAKAENLSQGRFVGGSHLFNLVSVKYPEYYAVKMPPHITNYHFNSAPKKRLMYNGKPLQFSLSSNLLFSGDGKWAICNTSEFAVNNTPKNSSFLISLVTGIVRKLNGTQAIFFAPSAARGIGNSTVYPGRGIGKIMLGINRETGYERLGKPTAIFNSIPVDAYNCRLPNGKTADLSLWHNNDRVFAIDVRDTPFTIANGLTEQSSLERIKAVYKNTRCLIKKQVYQDGWQFNYDFVDQGIAFCFMADYHQKIVNGDKPYKVAVHERGHPWVEQLTSE